MLCDSMLFYGALPSPWQQWQLPDIYFAGLKMGDNSLYNTIKRGIWNYLSDPGYVRLLHAFRMFS